MLQRLYVKRSQWDCRPNPAWFRTEIGTSHDTVCSSALMSDYDYVEHRGLGVPRKIVKLMREQNGTEPDVVEEKDRFLVRLWKEPGVVCDL